jgi:CDP-diacylglycerol--glycerol-3-phosphate 3-phosphatidyltransferase
MQIGMKEQARGLLDPLVGLLARASVTPTAVSLTGLAFALGAGVLIAGGRLRTGAVCLILSSLCDMLDGQLARRRGRTSLFGAFLDSCLDRLSEGAVFLGLALYLGPRGAAWLVLVIAALIGSMMVSYARARAEGLGLDCKVGVLERPERLVLLILALLVGGNGLLILLLVLTLLAFWTFLSRTRHVERQVRQRTQQQMEAQGVEEGERKPRVGGPVV